MPELPTAHFIGRTNFPAPVSGAYNTIDAGPMTVATALAATDDNIIVAFQAPMDMRLYRIAWYARTGGAGTTTGIFYKNSTPVTSGATRLQTGTAALDLKATAGAYVETASGGADTLVSSARDITKGQWVFVDATSEATGGLTDFSLQFTVAVTGHVNVSSAND